MKKKRKTPEQDLQKSCIQWLKVQKPKDLFWTAINPVSFKTENVRRYSAAMGMKAGVPDMLFIHNSKTFFIEMKSAKGSLDDTQKNVIFEINDCGVHVYVCKSLDYFIEIINGELK